MPWLSFLVTRTFTEAARRYLLSLGVHDEVVYVEMLKVVGIGFYRARKIRIVDYAKQ